MCLIILRWLYINTRPSMHSLRFGKFWNLQNYFLQSLANTRNVIIVVGPRGPQLVVLLKDQEQNITKEMKQLWLKKTRIVTIIQKLVFKMIRKPKHWPNVQVRICFKIPLWIVLCTVKFLISHWESFLVNSFKISLCFFWKNDDNLPYNTVLVPSPLDPIIIFWF